MKEIDNILKFLNNAKENKGLVLFDINLTYSREVRQELIYLFEHQISQHGHIIAPLTIGKGRGGKLKPSQKKYIERVIVQGRGMERYVNAYELFAIPEDQRTPDAFTPFIDFHQQIHELATTHFNNVFVQLLYETGPMRLEPSVSIKNPETKDVAEDTEKTKLFKSLVAEQPLLQNWFVFLANYLKTLGRWSWISIGYQGVLDMKEEHAQLNKWYKSQDQKEASTNTAS